MRCVTYAGESVITTDDVAEALVALTAAVASAGNADAVTIPIIDEATGAVGDAELVIGVGNDVLSAPYSWDGEEHDFSEAAQELREHRYFPTRSSTSAVWNEDPYPQMNWDPDLDAFR
jgi:hypothetical protein